MERKKQALFDLGRVVVTPGALEALEKAGEDPTLYLARHVSGDWGELDDHDRRDNEYSLERGLRLLSTYTLSTGVRLLIITEADRSATTLLLF